MDKYGSKLKDYRDSVAHNDPLHPGHTNMRVYPMHGRFGLVVGLPINPEVKSRDKYIYDGGPDSLSYCHEVLCHLVELGEGIAAEIGL